jgi:hypothetical protein
VFSSSNYTLTTGGVLIELISPVNANKTNIASRNYTCNATSEASKVLSNITLYLWNSSGNLVYNITGNYSGVENNSINNYTFTANGNYSWNCLGLNNASNSSFGVSNYTVLYDSTDPVISAENADASTESVIITWTTNEPANGLIGGEIFGINLSYSTSHSITISSLSSSTQYDYSITSCDEYGNCDVSSSLSFTTDDAGGGGGGGGGGASAQFLASNEAVRNGTIKLLKRGEEVVFNISNQRHILRVDSIYNNTVNITIQSEIIKDSLVVGKVKKFNLSSSQYYDLLINITSVGGSAAYVFIKEINEEIPSPIIIPKETSEIKEETTVDLDENKINKKINWRLLLFSILAIFIVIYLIEKLFFHKGLKKKKTSKRREIKKKNPYAV